LIAASVPSQVSTGFRQVSQPPQLPPWRSPKCARIACLRHDAVSQMASSALSLERSTRLMSSPAGALVDHPPALDHIGHAIGHPDLRRQPVAPGAAGLLVIGLDRARQIEMRDIAHVRLVDAHAEGDGRHKAEIFLFQEGILIGIAHGAVHAGVIGQRPDTLRVQPLGGILDLGARQAIDDAAVALVAGDRNRNSCWRGWSRSTIS
jgi:hypothetical protein